MMPVTGIGVGNRSSLVEQSLRPPVRLSGGLYEKFG